MTISLTLINRPLKDNTCNIVFDVVNGRDFRKKIITGIKVKSDDWISKSCRVKRSNPNSAILNIRLKELVDKQLTALAKYDANQFSEMEVVSFLEGKTAFGNIDEYIETEIKNTRKSATYIDYKNAVSALKLHTNFKGKLMFEDINYSLLDKLKRSALSKGRSGATVNSYLKKIRAVMNDAYDKGFIYEEFKLNKKLSVPVRRTIIKTCTPEDFENAIAKVKTLRDWQSLAFYLLMFLTRGMYQADIVNFKWANFKNKEMGVKYLDLMKNEYFYDDENPVGMVHAEGYDYLIHRRSKTRNKANADMLIRIDEFPTFELISALKYSVIYTHYNKRPEIIPALKEWMSIFNYDVVKDYKLHSNIWDYYTKRVKKLLGYSFNTARKTFNTYALELQVSDTIRRILLGHADPTMLSRYDNLSTKAIIEQVEHAHTSIIERFRASELTTLLLDKLKDINAPAMMYDKTIFLGNLKHFVKSHKEDLI